MHGNCLQLSTRGTVSYVSSKCGEWPRRRTDGGPTALRRRPDGGPTAARRRSDGAPTADRRRTDGAPTAARRRSDGGPTAARRRTDGAPTADRRRTDVFSAVGNALLGHHRGGPSRPAQLTRARITIVQEGGSS